VSLGVVGRRLLKGHAAAEMKRSIDIPGRWCTVLFRIKYKCRCSNLTKAMASKGKLVPAVGYLRTSNAATVGEGKDSEARQHKAIEAHAKGASMVIVEWFYDAAVSGADPIKTRPGFAAMLARIAGNGVRTIIVETANRFARDLMAQEVGFAMLRDLEIALIAADSPASFLDDGPTSKLIRQILGAVAEFDKALTVAKLKGARDRKRRKEGKCEGRKSYAECDPELVELAREIQRRGVSLHEVARQLQAQGRVTPSGKRYSASAVASMLRPLSAKVRQTGKTARAALAAAKAADYAGVIAELRTAGVTSLAGIAAALNERGIPTASGQGAWHAAQVSRVLARLGA
jgi:DNA invertase Pin-like site-specific DNA recombinase